MGKAFSVLTTAGCFFKLVILRKKAVCGLRLSLEKLTGYRDVHVSLSFIVGHLLCEFHELMKGSSWVFNFLLLNKIRNLTSASSSVISCQGVQHGVVAYTVRGNHRGMRENLWAYIFTSVCIKDLILENL